MPSSDRARVAQTRSVSDGASRRGRAARLRASLWAPGGVFSAWSPAAPDPLPVAAKRRAAVFQRSRAHGEGRNGYVSRCSPQLRGRDRPRKREGFTPMHTFCLTRPEGTTAAERLCGQKPRSRFAAMLDSVDLAPAPLSPPRKTYSGRCHDRGPKDIQEALEQWTKVQNFKKRLQQRIPRHGQPPLFYKEFTDTGHFREVLRQDLSLWLAAPERPWS
jgi:uncharacterized protein DUF6399